MAAAPTTTPFTCTRTTAAALAIGIRRDTLGRPKTVRTLIEFVGRHAGGLVCHRWLATTRSLALTEREEAALVRAVVIDHHHQNNNTNNNHFVQQNLVWYKIKTLVLRCPATRGSFDCNSIRGHRCFLANVTDAAAGAVIEHCPNLTAVDLTGCVLITNVSVARLTRSCDCHNLRSLKVGSQALISTHAIMNHNGVQQVINIGDAAINSLVQARCCKLATLELRGCHSITNPPFVNLADCCSRLTGLTLYSCSQVNDLAIIAVAKHCSILNRFELTYSNVTDDAIVSLANGCRKLSIVTLDRCPVITDVSVIALASKCHRLEAVGLLRNEKITALGFNALAANGSELASLNLNACTGLTYESLVSITAGCPKLADLEFLDTNPLGPDVSWTERSEAIGDLATAYPHISWVY